MKGKTMSRTIKAIERDMVPKLRTIQAEPARLVGEWQQRGPETLSGLGLRKLRLAFAPMPVVTTTSAAS
jgi:hypothetical protein